LKAINTDTAIGKYLINQPLFLKRKHFSFCEETENGPTIINIAAALHHCTDFPCHWEYEWTWVGSQLHV